MKDKQNMYDYVIVGSGFGASVSALRLTQKGYKVLIIEKGKWFKSKDFPKTNWNFKKWIWLPELRLFGIMKLTFFRHVGVLSGAGVGGGSLVYANTLPVPKTNFFTTGSWANLADWQEELKPHYKEALRMLGAEKQPKLFDADKELQKVAKIIGKEKEFDTPNVAVYFGEEGKTHPDPYFDGEGPERVGCNFCGACMTGCRNNSKNTLDKNYLYLAQKLGADIIAEHKVVDIKPLDNHDGSTGYEVVYRSSTKLFGKKKKRVTTQGVIVAGGVIGTIKLLLTLKKKSLPNISDELGNNIRTNNETLASINTLDKHKDYSKGVAIGSILHTDENTHIEMVRYSNGSGAWKLLHLPYAYGANFFARMGRFLGNVLRAPFKYFKIYFINSWSKKNTVILFMQTLDSTLKFKLNALGKMTSRLSTGKKPSPYIPESKVITDHFSKVANAKPSSLGAETITGIPTTAHILGGAVMGEDATKGVIDQTNHVFGYKNLMVVDGSMISANPGVNPSLSITAIAERAMSLIKPKNKEVQSQKNKTEKLDLV